MRLLICFVILAAAGNAAAQPLPVIDQAVKAHGGAEALVKTKAMVQTAKGRININGTDADATREAKFALPDRYSWLIDLRVGGASQRRLIVLNGLSGWQQVDAGSPTDIPTLIYDIIREEGYVLWLCTVAPLAEKGLTLKPAPGVAVDGQPTEGVTVTKPGKPEVTLYFAKSGGLLLKARFRSVEAGATKEWLFAKHKTFSGATLPTKLTDFKDGIRMGEWEVSDYKFVDKFDPATFRKP